MDKLERHFERELDRLTETTLRLGATVEQAIRQAIAALTTRDADLARQVIADDEATDQLELEIDQIAADLIALHQPAARDLRFIIGALKISPELERLGDLAGNIAERSVELCQEVQLKPLIDIPRMAELALAMVHDSLDAFVRRDAAAAIAVIRRDDQVDALMEQVFRELLSYMLEDPRTISRALRLMMVAKYVERIGDGATNICEMVVYMVEGRVIRHGGMHPSRLGFTSRS
ncbi:MAG TPA: phosphate signaling complex protein PhoU [Candidatus Polarisedimenticolaceae bacterium]|nr:phosphate signaling complex protein PhoU [Candidatus Polarisedimenticolaceae bacterium]